MVAITQARVGSSRLPRKVLEPMCGRPMLYWHLARLKLSREIDRIVVATTTEPGAEEIVAIAKDMGIEAIRGPVTDVLERFRMAAEGAASVVRVTSDCPLIDPALLDRLVATYLADPDCDYCSLDVSRFPRGLDCEVFGKVALDEVAAATFDPADREHVTLYMRAHGERWKLRFIDPGGVALPYRWCVDTPEDFRSVERLLAALGTERLDFGWREMAETAASL